MSAELQSWVAGAIVLVTMAIFLFRTLKGRFRKGGGGSCGSGCGCGAGNVAIKVKKPGETEAASTQK